MMQRLTEKLICLIALWKNKPVQAISLKIFMHWPMEAGIGCHGLVLGSFGPGFGVRPFGI